MHNHYVKIYKNNSNKSYVFVMLWNNCIIFVDKLVKYNFDPLLAKLETMLNIWETLKNMLRGNLSFIVVRPISRIISNRICLLSFY